MNVWRHTRRVTEATRAAADRVQGEVTQAWQDRHQWTGRANEAYSELARRGEELLARTDREGRRWARKVRENARRIPGVAAAEGELSGLASTPEELPIADYAHLTVEQLLPRLPALSQRELHQVEGYEANNHARVTVLRRIDELRGTEPWAAYDEMTVDEIMPRLRALSPEQRATVATYEERHKQRRTVLHAAKRDEPTR